MLGGLQESGRDDSLMTGLEAVIQVVTRAWSQRTRIPYCKPGCCLLTWGFSIGSTGTWYQSRTEAWLP